MRIKNVRLTITEACNLNCIYCYEKHKSGRVMSFDTARGIVDFELFHANAIDQLNFEFFGGEPFLNFPIIQYVSEYIWNKKSPMRISLSAVTNGTAFTDAAKTWLLEHGDKFELGFSIDGGRQTQNENRSNSYSLIDKDFIKQYPRASIKMTISPLSIQRLAEDVMYLHKFNCPIGCNIDYDANWCVDDGLIEIFSEQLNILINYYLERPNIKPCTLLNIPVMTVLSKPINYILKPCGAGVSVVAYSCDGQSYPCQGFMPLSSGKTSLEKIDFIEKIPVSLLPKDCQNCPIINSCPNCFASNYYIRGDIYNKPLNLCRLIKLFYKASSYLKFRQMETVVNSMTPEDEMRTLVGIKIIQERFK